MKNGIKGLGGIEYIVVDANGKNHVISNPSDMVELNSQELKDFEIILALTSNYDYLNERMWITFGETNANRPLFNLF